ncbi:XTP/dITP diphosphatase [Desulfoplanes sp.]
MSTIVLATGNQGKIREFATMFGELMPHVTVCGVKDFPDIGGIEETGTTFGENSRIKAEAVSRLTGHVAVADDSGLEVDVLGGRPGVYSARFSGPGATDERNYLKLLEEMKNVPQERRTARFVCVITAFAPNGQTLVARGTWEGHIARSPIGENGFGYDPVFFDGTAQMTSAQMDQAMKNSRSHRGKALQSLLEQWPLFWKKVGHV